MKIKELLLLETYHIAGKHCRLFFSEDGNYSVHGNGDTMLELNYPFYIGKDEDEAVAVFLETESLYPSTQNIFSDYITKQELEK